MKRHYHDVRLHQSHPLNVAALRLLPEDWKDPIVLPVVSLMLWGIREGGIGVRAHTSHPDRAVLESFVVKMGDADPLRAMSVLTEVYGQQVLRPDALDSISDPVEAAALLLETLHANLVATNDEDEADD